MVNFGLKDQPTKIWLRFEAVHKDGTVKKYVIQNLPFSMVEKALLLMRDHFIPEEPFSCSSMAKSMKNIEYINNFWRHYAFPQGNSIICLEDNDEPIENKEIVGLNVLFHRKISDPPSPSDIDENDFTKMLSYVEDQVDIYKEFNVTEYLTAFGLCVNKNYRGLQVGKYLLEARVPICKSLGIKLTETIFTGTGAQKIAERLNYSLIYEMTFEELSKKTGVPIDKKFTCLKVMVKYME